MKFFFSIVVVLAVYSCTASKGTNRAMMTYCSDQIFSSINVKFELSMDTVDLCDFVLEDGVAINIAITDVGGCKRLAMDDFIIDYIELNDGSFPHKNCNFLITLESKRSQTDEYKLGVLKKLRDEYNGYSDTANDYNCGSCQSVLINGQSDFTSGIRDRLNQLKVKDILYIKTYNKPMNVGLYGAQGNSNGIVEIQTK